MIGFLPAIPAAMPVRSRPTRASIIARMGQLDSDLTAESEGYEAALVLVAGVEIGQNIDRIARLTGVRREVVARIARRLVDNGVWCAGDTVSQWRNAPGERDSFRMDVAVGVGSLCRRTDESGRLEWAPPGYWRKDFEYGGPRAEEQPHAVKYHPHVEVPEAECLFVPEDELAEDEDDEVEEVGREVPRSRTEGVPAEGGAVWLGGGEAAVTGDEGWMGGRTDAPGEEAGGIVWLGGDGVVPEPVGGRTHSRTS